MSWQLASYAILGIVLLAGFTWYEHSHPSSKVLALVATLAALAALGRVAFAPLPNVKPTTDIVLLAGFALGGAPGFTVGAVAALSSNLVFGQGPWTPWQMGAWGAIGVLGAILGAISGRRMGRVPLALCCLAAGFAYGAILDFSTLVTFSGGDRFGQYLAISAAALPFNIAHAVGNFVFCMAFGPAFVRALLRFRARFQVDWRPLPATPAGGAATAAGVLAAIVLAGTLAGAAAQPARAAGPARATATATAAATGRSVAYLLAAQNSDGGFGPGPGSASTSLQTSTALQGLAAAGRHARRSPTPYLKRIGARTRDLGELERTILGLVAAGANPHRSGGRDLVRVLAAKQRRDGSFGGQVLYSAFAIFALRASGRPASNRAIRRAASFVARQQNPDRGFGFLRRGSPSGVDETAAALQGLVAGGRRRRGPVAGAAAFLARRQNPDGGFALAQQGASNAQSTAWAIQGFVAAGRNPNRVKRKGSRSALAYLRSLVGPNGSVRYSRTSRQTPVWVTGQALMALAGKALPIRAPRRAR